MEVENLRHIGHRPDLSQGHNNEQEWQDKTCPKFITEEEATKGPPETL